MKKQRDFTRVPIPFPVQITRDGEATLYHTPIDMSATGIHMRATDPPAIGTQVGVEILVGERYVIEAQARVVWQRDGDYGLRFETVDARGYELLKDLIRFHAMDVDKVEREFEQHFEELRESA